MSQTTHNWKNKKRFLQKQVHFEHFLSLSFGPCKGHNSVNIGLNLRNLENKSFNLTPSFARLIVFDQGSKFPTVVQGGDG